jgi:hypothetical protein
MHSMIYHDPDSVITVFEDAIRSMHPDDLAFLLATGKSELELRTQIALHLNRHKGPFETIAREWARHDLVIFNHGLPTVVVEGKSWLHADAVNEKKLMKGSKSIRHGLEEDLKKLEKSYKTFLELNTYITMLNFSIDVRRLDMSHENADIKYVKTHLKGLHEFRNLEDLAGHGRSRISDLLTQYGTVKRIPLRVGNYLNMPMEADFYLLQPHF